MEKLKQIIQFEKMLTPYLMKGLFWGGSLFALASIAMVHADQRWVTACGAVIFIMLLRVVCEIILTLFKR